MIKTLGPPWIPRVVLALLSLGIVIFGAASFFNGETAYFNSRGGIVFAPVAIITGVLGLIIAVFKPFVFAKPPKKKSRFRGWPKGRARY
jgi:hypothetical protein